MKVISTSLVRHQSEGYKPFVQALIKLSRDDVQNLEAMNARDWDGMLATDALIFVRELYTQLKGQLNGLDSSTLA